MLLFEPGSGQLTGFHCISSFEAKSFKPTVFKFHPPICGVTARAKMPG
jgi:hypothetical protein